MTEEKLNELLELDYFSEKFIQTREELNKNILSKQKDLYAFNLIANRTKRNRCIIMGAAHDIIYLDISKEDLMKSFSENDVSQLRVCGISFDESIDSFYMYV
jgi:hypothetical protein